MLITIAAIHQSISQSINQSIVGAREIDSSPAPLVLTRHVSRRCCFVAALPLQHRAPLPSRSSRSSICMRPLSPPV